MKRSMQKLEEEHPDLVQLVMSDNYDEEKGKY